MRRFLSGAVFIALVLLFQSCYYDHPPEPAPIDPDMVSFSTHIIPIFQKACSTSGCHDGARSPNLLAEVAWQEIQKGGFVNLAIPRESILYRSVEYELGADPMPPGGPQLPALDRQLILLWIQKGAPND